MIGRRGVVLLLWLAAVVLAVLQIVRTPFTADLSAFLPARPDARQQVLIDQLKSGLPARTLMLAIEGGDEARRAAASRELARALRAGGLFEQVHNGETDAWAGVGQWIVEHRYALSPAVAPERFTPAGLADAIGESLSLLGTPAGQPLKALIERDPTGETVRIAEALIPSRAPRSVDGAWAARDAPRALLMVVTRAAGADLDAQAQALRAVEAAFAPQQAAGLTLRMSGTPFFAVDSRTRIESEVHWLAAAGTVLMSALLLLAFRSLRAFAVAALPVASGVLAGIAAVSLGFGSVHGMTLGFGTTLIGEAVDYAIYYMIQARGGSPGWRRWLAEGWPTVRLGLLTSVCGFAALVFSGFPGLAQLGVYSVAGLAAAALTTRFVLPHLMPDGARGPGLGAPLLHAWRGALAALPRTRALWLAAGAAAALVLVQRGDLWKADLASLSPVPPALLALDAQLRAELLPGDSGALLVVQGDSAEAALQAAEDAGARLDALIEQRVIAGYDSAARLLPSVATQQRRRAALPDEATLRAALAEATRDGPLRAGRLEPFIADVAAARTRAPDTPAGIRGSALAPLVDALLVPVDGRWTALLPLAPLPGATVDTQRVAQALQGVPTAQVLDIGPELTRLYARYLAEAQWQALLGAAGVLVLIGLALRSWRRVAAVALPLALAVLLTMGALAAFGVTLGILHLVGLLLVVAVGSNYALFFDGRALPDDDTLASLLLANVTTVLSFGLLALSSMPALSAIGRVVGPGALLALLLAAAFAPRRR